MRFASNFWVFLILSALLFNCSTTKTVIEPEYSMQKAYVLLRSEGSEKEINQLTGILNSEFRYNKMASDVFHYPIGMPWNNNQIFSNAYDNNYDYIVLIDQVAKFTIDNRTKVGGKYQIRSYHINSPNPDWIDLGQKTCNISVKQSVEKFSQQITKEIVPNYVSSNTIDEVSPDSENQSSRISEIDYNQLKSSDEMDVEIEELRKQLEIEKEKTKKAMAEKERLEMEHKEVLSFQKKRNQDVLEGLKKEKELVEIKRKEKLAAEAKEREAKIAEVKKIEEKHVEEKRLAELKRKEEAKLKELAIKEKEAKLAEAKRLEEKHLEEERLAELKRKELARLKDLEKKENAAKLAEAKRLEEKRLEEERLAELKRKEEARLKELEIKKKEAKLAEAKRLEEKRLEKERLAELKRKEEARLKELAIKEEEAKLAEAKRLEEKRLEEERLAELKKKEEARLKELAIKEQEAKLAEAKRLEEKLDEKNSLAVAKLPKEAKQNNKTTSSRKKNILKHSTSNDKSNALIIIRGSEVDSVDLKVLKDYLEFELLFANIKAKTEIYTKEQTLNKDDVLKFNQPKYQYLVLIQQLEVIGDGNSEYKISVLSSYNETGWMDLDNQLYNLKDKKSLKLFSKTVLKSL